MARLSIALPDSFQFFVRIPVRITDVNYGGHVGNDSILSIIHEARMAFLFWNNYTEKDMAGVGLIMGDVAISFKNELFYGDELTVHIAVADVTRSTFDLVYKLEKEAGGKTIDVAYAKTGMVCFDYERRRVAALPDEARRKFGNY